MLFQTEEPVLLVILVTGIHKICTYQSTSTHVYCTCYDLYIMHVVPCNCNKVIFENFIGFLRPKKANSLL